MKDWKETYQDWLKDPGFDDAFRCELEGLTEQEVRENFSGHLSFGTGGIRAKLGAGPARLNRYLVMRVAQAIALHLTEHAAAALVIIAWDTRSHSHAFALEAARVLLGNGLAVRLFDRPAATPELSHAIRFSGAQGGIMFTASHNPKEDHGLKVYREDGCQLLPGEAAKILAVEEALAFSAIRTGDLAGPLLGEIGRDVHAAYRMAASRKVMSHGNRRLRIVYTPLHGTGAVQTLTILREAGFDPVPVEAQMVQDPDFSTVAAPNPEFREAFALAEDVGNAMEADLLLATDPDADRLGVMVRHKGGYVKLSGDQVGALLCDALLPVDPKAVVISSIVSSHLYDRIAAARGARLYKTLTGFKHVGALVTRLETTDDVFVMAYEESCGYLLDTHIRDKDGIQAALMVADLADRALWKGKTLVDVLETLYGEFGYFMEGQLAFRMDGEDGARRIQAVMARFRHAVQFEFDGVLFAVKRDFMSDESGLPPADVLKFENGRDAWFAVRPSGTEPKLKIHLSAAAQTFGAAEKMLKDMERKLGEFVWKTLE